jgi:hypothetical protein
MGAELFRLKIEPLGHWAMLTFILFTTNYHWAMLALGH